MLLEQLSREEAHEAKMQSKDDSHQRDMARHSALQRQAQARAEQQQSVR